MEESLERLRPQLENAGCPLTVDIPKSVVGHWDRFRIEQVLANLMGGNAEGKKRVVLGANHGSTGTCG